MKKILAALMMTGLAYCSANAQTKQTTTCGIKQNHVCRVSKDKNSVSCYKTAYAENFKVCKSDEHGYFICCEIPGLYNSTHYNYAADQHESQKAEQDQYVRADYNNSYIDMVVPQNQSYVNTTYSLYEENYLRKGGKKACYVGSNVAASTRAPYEGCASPQSDGPDANKQRNLNVSNPASMPPLAGQPK